MLRRPKINRRPLAIVMLLMVVWQCLFVAVEAGAHAPSPGDIHHRAGAQADAVAHDFCLGVPCPDGGEGVDDSHATEGEDYCDHCCACQGHCSHLPIQVKTIAVELSPPGFQPGLNPQQSFSLHPPSIYRPPIC